MSWDNFVEAFFSANFLYVVIRVSVPLVLASISAYMAALTGVGNIAVEGIMLMSCLMAVLGSYWTQSAVLGLLIALLTGVVMALMIYMFSMSLGAQPLLAGIALNTFASSFTVFLLYQFTNSKGSSANLSSKVLPVVDIPLIQDIPILGEIISGHYLLTYVTIVLVILLYIMIYKTPIGMQMKACGLNEQAARSVGIHVTRMKLLSMLLSGLTAAIGGAYMTMGYASIFSKDMVAGRGWIGIAAQGIAGINYVLLLIVSMIFSVFQAITNVFLLYDLPSELINIIPYVGVLLGVIFYSVAAARKHKQG